MSSSLSLSPTNSDKCTNFVFILHTKRDPQNDEIFYNFNIQLISQFMKGKMYILFYVILTFPVLLDSLVGHQFSASIVKRDVANNV